jgi:hypothetical protein
MTKLFTLTIWLLGALLLFGSFCGCTNSKSNSDDEHLIRVGDRVLTVLEFNQAFEISKTAYPHNLRFDPDDFKNAQLRLLNQLMGEMIILERAKELGLYISDEELAKAVADIKIDYPEDTFEKTLLEFAVSYESWEAQLKKRLLMEKVVDSELKNQIVITPEDIARYYEKNFKIQESDMDSATKIENINEMIIKQLRREKTEEAYTRWIQKLKQQYPIEINSIQWEKIFGSNYNEDQDLGALNSTNK